MSLRDSVPLNDCCFIKDVYMTNGQTNPLAKSCGTPRVPFALHVSRQPNSKTREPGWHSTPAASHKCVNTRQQNIHACKSSGIHRLRLRSWCVCSWQLFLRIHKIVWHSMIVPEWKFISWPPRSMKWLKLVPMGDNAYDRVEISFWLIRILYGIKNKP